MFNVGNNVIFLAALTSSNCISVSACKMKIAYDQKDYPMMSSIMETAFEEVSSFYNSQSDAATGDSGR